jgi:hypothetical protein
MSLLKWIYRIHGGWKSINLSKSRDRFFLTSQYFILRTSYMRNVLRQGTFQTKCLSSRIVFHGLSFSQNKIQPLKKESFNQISVDSEIPERWLFQSWDQQNLIIFQLLLIFAFHVNCLIRSHYSRVAVSFVTFHKCEVCIHFGWGQGSKRALMNTATKLRPPQYFGKFLTTVINFFLHYPLPCFFKFKNNFSETGVSLRPQVKAYSVICGLVRLRRLVMLPW